MIFSELFISPTIDFEAPDSSLEELRQKQTGSINKKEANRQKTAHKISQRRQPTHAPQPFVIRNRRVGGKT